MITEFTCGIYHAEYIGSKWLITVNQYNIANVDNNGIHINFDEDFRPTLTCDHLIEIAVLMNNIKRQYKQLQVNQQG